MGRPAVAAAVGEARWPVRPRAREAAAAWWRCQGSSSKLQEPAEQVASSAPRGAPQRRLQPPDLRASLAPAAWTQPARRRRGGRGPGGAQLPDAALELFDRTRQLVELVALGTAADEVDDGKDRPDEEHQAEHADNEEDEAFHRRFRRSCRRAPPGTVARGCTLVPPRARGAAGGISASVAGGRFARRWRHRRHQDLQRLAPVRAARAASPGSCRCAPPPDRATENHTCWPPAPVHRIGLLRTGDAPSPLIQKKPP